jgi:pyruvate dehydrogenase E2 component (dihydrolipoamide acetyltransferase)
MPIEIVVPKLGLTMKEALIVEWKKKEADEVKKGEVLFVLETEKVTYEVESPEDGILGKILIKEKETVPVGTVLAYLLRPGESISELKEVKVMASEEGMRGEAVPADEAERLSKREMREDIRVKASPLAKKLAKSYGIELETVNGSGPGGRILKEDIEKAYEKIQMEGSPPSAEAKEAVAHNLVTFTGMRRAIAKKMLASKVETAQTYMSNTVDASKIVEYRKALLEHVEKKVGVRLSITDIMMKITGAAIREHPIINTQWTEEGILYLEDVHMGMAMALEEGLIVPVIRDICKKTFTQIAKERTELIKKGRENRFLPDDITGSTFTLSAMGMFGIEQFTANINLPESAILAVGAIMDKPVIANGEVLIRPMMNVTLSYDHRTIDGAEAGKFMRTLKSFIEEPILIFA